MNLAAPPNPDTRKRAFRTFEMGDREKRAYDELLQHVQGCLTPDAFGRCSAHVDGETFKPCSIARPLLRAYERALK